MGRFSYRIDPAKAPLTCANIAGLAEGLQHRVDPTTGSVRNNPFYDPSVHRVITNFVIQGGPVSREMMQGMPMNMTRSGIIWANTRSQTFRLRHSTSWKNSRASSLQWVA